MPYVISLLIAVLALAFLWLLRIYLFSIDWKFGLWWKDPVYDGATPDLTGYRRWLHTWSRPIRWRYSGWKRRRRWQRILDGRDTRHRFREVPADDLSKEVDHEP